VVATLLRRAPVRGEERGEAYFSEGLHSKGTKSRYRAKRASDPGKHHLCSKSNQRLPCTCIARRDQKSRRLKGCDTGGGVIRGRHPLMGVSSTWREKTTVIHRRLSSGAFGGTTFGSEHRNCQRVEG